MRNTVVATLITLLVGYPFSAHSEVGPEPVEFGCGEVVLIGLVGRQTYRAVPPEPEPPPPPGYEVYRSGVGRISMKIQVKQVLEGRVRSRRIGATMVAHTLARRDTPLLFVLKPSRSGTYEVRDIEVVERGEPLPSLLKRCP